MRRSFRELSCMNLRISRFAPSSIFRYNKPELCRGYHMNGGCYRSSVPEIRFAYHPTCLSLIVLRWCLP